VTKDHLARAISDWMRPRRQLVPHAAALINEGPRVVGRCSRAKRGLAKADRDIEGKGKGKGGRSCASAISRAQARTFNDVRDMGESHGSRGGG